MELVGTIIDSKNKLVLRQFVGTAGNEELGEDSIELSTANDYSPILQYKDKFFHLRWSDILLIAKERGLFDGSQNLQEEAQ